MPLFRGSRRGRNKMRKRFMRKQFRSMMSNSRRVNMRLSRVMSKRRV